jgi:murein DD-endopeptidase MepM/ murein hydrolase activator NlpD
MKIQKADVRPQMRGRKKEEEHLTKSVVCALFSMLFINACTDRKGPPAPVSVNGAALQTQNLPSIIVKRGDTVVNVAQRYHITPAEIITLNRLKPSHHLRIGQKLLLPQRVMGGGNISSSPHTEGKGHTFISTPPKPGQVTAVPLDPPVSTVTKPVIKSEFPALEEPIPVLKSTSGSPDAPAPEPENRKKPTPMVEEKTIDHSGDKPVAEKLKDESEKVEPVMAQLEEAVSQGKKTKGGDSFAWPLKGKILKNFGKSDTGFQNDGINIQANEGDPIQCVEDGMVAYAGNELQGFGNLIMVKHRNGWMSAYAHCSETLVKRGDKVKRGKVIAKVGHSGSVRSPQLHFELRKKTKAVDPLTYLE